MLKSKTALLTLFCLILLNASTFPGGIISRSRNKPSDYVKAEFVKSVKGDRVDVNYGGKNKKLFDDITVQDAKWLSGWLSRLSDEQIKDDSERQTIHRRKWNNWRARCASGSMRWQRFQRTLRLGKSSDVLEEALVS